MKNFILFLLLSCSIFGFSQPAFQPSWFDDLIATYEIPGMSIAVVEGDKITYSGVLGVRATDSKKPVTSQTVFAAASLSKPIFAYAVMQLVEAGKIDLDKPVYQYLEYKDVAHDDRYKNITARMLLSHSSGLPNWRRGKLKILFDPGQKFQYSGEGFVYLMRVVEHITRKSINDFMKETVFDPLGMTHTSYLWEDRFAGNFAAPHNDFGFAESKYKPQEGNTAHSLQTTAEDFGKFLIALLNNRDLSQKTMKQVMKPQVKVGDSGNLHWGLGWGIQQTTSGEAIWQWGDNGTYRAFVMAYPGAKKAMVYFTNSTNGLRMVSKVAKKVFEDECIACDWMGYNTTDNPRQQLFKAILKQGYEKGSKPFLHANQIHQDTSRINEWEMNNIGYRLINLHRYADAKKVLYANMKAFPTSANAYDSYAEVCLKNGEPELARKYYQKALDLNPKNPNAKSIVRCLDADGPKGNTTFRFDSYPYARLISLAGEFNNWNALSHPFTRQNGEWVCKIDLEPGTYEYKIIIDGVWTLDPENIQVKKNGGNINSVIIVEK